MRLVLTCVACAASLALAGPAGAQPRPDITAMSCAAAADLVARSGAAILTTGPITYGRFVRDSGFCTIEKATTPAYEQTRDDPRCFIGYRCVDPFSEGPGRP
jgi:hypothetical protein